MNTRDVPLSVYVFSQNQKFQKTVTDNTQSGNVMIHETLVAVGAPGLPAGGKGPGGYVYYTGKHGFDQFVHLRCTPNNPTWVDKLVFKHSFPPYTAEGIKKLRATEAALPPRPGTSDSISTTAWVLTALTVLMGASSFVALRSANHV